MAMYGSVMSVSYVWIHILMPDVLKLNCGQ